MSIAECGAMSVGEKDPVRNRPATDTKRKLMGSDSIDFSDYTGSIDSDPIDSWRL
jgi:hypothetical protein